MRLPVRVLQEQISSAEFAMWSVFLEKRAEGIQQRRAARTQRETPRDPRAVYQEFRAALLTYTGAKQHDGR